MANKSKAKRTQTVNPYTFVPLRGYKDPNKFKITLGKPAQDGNAEPLYTGKFSCNIVTKTELAIPDSAKASTYTDPARKGMKSYPFYRVDDRLTIPGSSLRGSIRSIYEIITNSCLHVNDARFHSRSARKKAGLLKCEDGIYKLYSATRYPLYEDKSVAKSESFDNLENGQLVSINTKTLKNSRKVAYLCQSGANRGYYLKVDTFTNEATGDESHPSVFAIGARVGEIPQVYIDCFEENIQLYGLSEVPDIETGKREQKPYAVKYYKSFKQMQTGECTLPVWYLESDGVYEFAPSQMSRSVYPKKVSDFLGKVGLDACQLPDNCCPACSLFGMISNNNQGAKAGRVRFSDAKLIGETSSTRKVIFPAMMGPKISAFEFYLYNSSEDKKFSFGLNDDDTKLSGRKMYWHHQNGLSGYEQKIDPDRPDLQSEYEVLSKGAQFTFDVFFDGITLVELNQLAYALTLGEYLDSDGKEYCHKIGHGKPLGLGSVAVSIQDCAVRSYSENTYKIAHDNSWKMSRNVIEGKLSSLQALKNITNFAAVSEDKTISYPTDDKGEIFGWFADNRSLFSDEDGSDKYVEVLKKGLPGYIFNEAAIDETNPEYRPKKVEKKKKNEPAEDSRWQVLKNWHK